MSADGAQPEPSPFSGGAVTWISAADLAAMAEGGQTTVGVPQPVNGRQYGDDCPECLPEGQRRGL